MNSISLSLIYFILVIVLAHFFSPSEYRWTNNTISDLAAQGVKYQWIMQAGFIGFGLLLNLGFLQKFIAARKVSYPDILIMLFGLSVLITGFFSTAPFIDSVNFSAQESNLHSLFATIAGICFTAGIFLHLVTASTPAQRWLDGVFLILVIGASLAFGLSENGTIPLGKGIIQRLLYLVSFLWLFVSQI
jgi:hypothetical protein